MEVSQLHTSEAPPGPPRLEAAELLGSLILTAQAAKCLCSILFVAGLVEKVFAN